MNISYMMEHLNREYRQLLQESYANIGDTSYIRGAVWGFKQALSIVWEHVEKTRKRPGPLWVKRPGATKPRERGRKV